MIHLNDVENVLIPTITSTNLTSEDCDERVVIDGVVGDWILRGDIEQVAQFSVYVRGDFDYVLSVGLSGAYPCEAAHCPATKP